MSIDEYVEGGTTVSGHEFIDNASRFRELHHVVAQTIDLAADLPSRVFLVDYPTFCFFEDVTLFAEDFLQILRELSAWSGDESVLMAVLEPDPEGASSKSYGYYPWVLVETENMTTEDYAAVFDHHPPDRPGEVFHDCFTRLAVLTVSRQWCVWVDRRWEVAILGIAGSGVPGVGGRGDSMLAAYWEGVDLALEIVADVTRRPVTHEFAAAMRRNYS